MFEFLKKKEINLDICSPVDGECIKIDEVNDEVFSAKMMGDGFAVKPSSNIVCTPIEGKIATVADTKHAFGVERKDGMEVLVHIGLNTVDLKGEGFEVLGRQGTKVKAGDPMIRFDKEFMEGKGVDLTTIVIFTAGYENEVNLDSYGSIVKAGETLMK